MFQQAEHTLVRGTSVLIDASFQRAHHRRQARELAQRVGAKFCMLECWCPEEEIRRRLELRATSGTAVSDGRWELVAEQQRAFEPLFEIPPDQLLRVDTTEAPEVAAERVVATLGLMD